MYGTYSAFELLQRSKNLSLTKAISQNLWFMVALLKDFPSNMIGFKLPTFQLLLDKPPHQLGHSHSITESFCGDSSWPSWAPMTLTFASTSKGWCSKQNMFNTIIKIPFIVVNYQSGSCFFLARQHLFQTGFLVSGFSPRKRSRTHG